MKKMLVVILSVIFGSSAFAGQGEGSCKSFAEKVAKNLSSFEVSDEEMNGTTVEVSLKNVSLQSSQTHWHISYINSSNEWAILYTIETYNVGSKQEEVCLLDAVEVVRAG